MEATPRPWLIIRGDENLCINGQGGFVCTMDQPPSPEREANAALIVHAVNNIERITAERDGLLSEVECLNSNARVQAKLLADTGRERDGLRSVGTKVVEAMTALDNALGERGCVMQLCSREAEMLANSIEDLEDTLASLSVSDAEKNGAA